MIGVDSVGGWSQTAEVVGMVLLDAIVLYVGYGRLERLVGSTGTDAIRGER